MKQLFLLAVLHALLAASAFAETIDPTPLLYSTSGRGVNWRQNGGTFPPNGTPATPAPTPNQFRGMVIYGAVTRPGTHAFNTGLSYAANAVSLDLSRGMNGGTVVAVLRAAQVGAPYYSRMTAAYFGGIIDPPATTETGASAPAGYWQAQPYATPSDTTPLRYYWSPHAGVVFATQPGPLQITWIKAQGANAQPAGTTAGKDILNLGGIFYVLTNVNYVISGSPDKTPRKIYWTERTFQPTSKPVNVPAARIGVVNIVYNTAVPERVTSEFVALGQSLLAPPSETLQEKRTLWYEQGQIHAYNVEGRVFVEFLGDTLGGVKRQYLGCEIVDLLQQPYPSDVQTELGEKIGAYERASTNSDAALNPVPLDAAVSGNQPFLYRHTANDSDRVEYFATAETVNQNDALVYWMEAGVQNLRWPLIYARYKLVWPSDVARYSHSVRPLVATEAEAKLTAVPLPNENVPTIQYQDPLDQPRGKLTENFAYYTLLDAAHPVHRGLLRFTAGDRVAFERVFSWLDIGLKSPDLLSGSLATNLTQWKVVPAFNAFDIKDLSAFAKKLKDAADPVSISLKNQLSATTLAALAAYDPGTGAGADILRQGLVADFNVFLAGDNWLTWAASESSRYWNSVASSSDGSKLVAVELGGKIYTSTDAGASWIPRASNRNWWSVASSSDGSKLVAVVFAGQIYTSTDAGASWTPRASNRNWNSVASSSDGRKLVAVEYGGQIYTSTDAGVNWTASENSRNWWSVASSSDGSKLVSVVQSGRIYTATQPGAPFVPNGTDPYQANRAFFTTSYPNEINPGQSVVSPNGMVGPRVISQTAYIGSRINFPADEIGTNDAGYILQTNGNSFHPGAYIDPFTHGFAAAQLGAIIPVNAIPGSNNLDVWWFRTSSTNAATSGVKTLVNGFQPIYWPAVIGRYNLAWPTVGSTNYSEIVLASNEGSGVLPSLQAKGTIYTQNEPTLPGYNPNEEHAVMIGGQAYALRDDLNLTTATVSAVLTGANATYSSQPFVLLDYTESDGRPAMRAFKVLREKPSAGIMFDYVVQAGANASDASGSKPLQAPMPLPLLPAPVEYITSGTGPAATITKINYNVEPELADNRGDLPANWSTLTSADKSKYANYKHFTYKDRKDQFWVLRGVHTGLPGLQAGKFTGSADASAISFSTVLDAARAVVGQPFTNTFHVSRPAGSLVMTLGAASPALPNGLNIDGLTVSGTPTATQSATSYTFVIKDIGDNASVTVTLSLKVDANGTATPQTPLIITGGNNATFTGRPPFLAAAPTSTNSFTMRFYYKTQEGFAWPGDPTPPVVGSIVPYLRPAGSTADAGAKTTAALDIVYRPVWPGAPPTLQFGETLMAPDSGRPAVRGQTSVQLLYQQAIAKSFTTDGTAPTPAVVLHDPTREKSYALKAASTEGLDKLPAGVKTDNYQGKTYFPNLPPHLAKRFFFDPNRGAKGALVFKGEYHEKVTKRDWVQLNVLTGTTFPGDLARVKALCPDSPADQKSAWDKAIDGLATTVETFYENPSVPGQFIVYPVLTKSVGIGDLAEITDDDTAVDSYALSASGPGQGYVTMIVGNGAAFTPVGDPVSVYVFQVTGTLYRGDLVGAPNDNPLSELVSLQHTADLGGRFSDYDYEWKINPPVDGSPPMTDATMSQYQALVSGTNLNHYTLGGAGIQGLVDNYIVMRYRPKKVDHPLYNQWSEWTEPQLVEGWIKRVLAGINPFGQRVTDLYNHNVNTDVSVLTSAGKRWEGDIALNLTTINNYGLIEIYETVLRRGRGLSIDAGINFGPANDALLLAAGYLNDLYMLVGNEAYADAANPTIGIGTKDKTYGDIATSLFAFKGQLPSLLEEELGLLRGRDDFLQPGVSHAPAYNRLWWNYTRGIDAGEVIYALNYNILDQNADGKIDASDAVKLYPQGHGDAYGHYLTAVKGYYSLLLNNNFDWVPRIEAVSILDTAVAVDYLDERKFAAAAAAVARTGRQVFDLTWRKDFQPGQDSSWEPFSDTRVNASRTLKDGTNPVREWGIDQWAARTQQGAYFNWIVGNAILPPVDPDPGHEGIQKIDRTTVPELSELSATGADLQTAMDNAEGRLTPLGLAQGSLAFDLNPNTVVGADPQTHFEQVYSRAKVALNNAVISFDDAKDVTRLMRSEEDSLADFAAGVARQELAYTNQLIELYGTPYTDDIGPGKTYPQDYVGPDFYHYAYVDNVMATLPGLESYDPSFDYTFDVTGRSKDYIDSDKARFDFYVPATSEKYSQYITIHLNSRGFFEKPVAWTGRRVSPGKLQDAISRNKLAYLAVQEALGQAKTKQFELDRRVEYFHAKVNFDSLIDARAQQSAIIADTAASVQAAAFISLQGYKSFGETLKDQLNVQEEAVSSSQIVGTAAGGDILAPVRAALAANYFLLKTANNGWALGKEFLLQSGTVIQDSAARHYLSDKLNPWLHTLEEKQLVVQLDTLLDQLHDYWFTINKRLEEYDSAGKDYKALLAQGNRILLEREGFRQRTAAVIQGYRTRDAAFRIFRNEKLERYKSLFDLAARYSYLAANAYDYETGLLGTDQGKSHLNRIVSSRALGVVKNGEPQFAGSDTGDPGLSSALAEMKADWDVLKGRLGFNNPDAYGTTASLRTGKLRILPGADSDADWQNVLQQGRMDNLLDDADVRRYCLQIDPGAGQPVPGIVLTFSTTIVDGMNLFGLPLAAGDRAFNGSAFATKLFGVGVALEGYRGMQDPVANGTMVNSAGGISPSDPTLSYLDPLALSGDPYVYLIPVGVDSMRSPPLGDTSEIRTWSVADVAIPLPFNIGGSDFSTKPLWQSSDSLTEALFAVRKHQAFRPVATTTAFNSSLYTGSGSLQRSQYTNNRLIGRSAWNSQWKLVIPGPRLLSDPKEGLDRFVQTVKDVKLHFITYSYSGN